MKINPLLDMPLPDHFMVTKTNHSGDSFTNWLTQEVQKTNSQLLEADSALQQLASGHADNLHQTMLVMEQAKLSFQCLEQVRNRLMNAYQEILREQI